MCGTGTVVGRSSWGRRARGRLGGAGAVILLASVLVAAVEAEEATGGDPQRGYRFLLDTAYLPPDFDQETFDRVWQVWPEPLRSRAARASASQRWQMALDRYGLTARPDDPRKPLQYVVGEDGSWTMNCFACHAGRVAGQVIGGGPNSSLALELLTAETRRIKVKLGKPLGRMDVGMWAMPLGRTRGTTNAVMFGVALMAFRDAQLNVYPDRRPPAMVHHDMDAPAWWHFRKKRHLYIDGFAPKGVRPLMQFMLVTENGPERFAEWEEDYRHIYAYLESLAAPPYPFQIDLALAEQGQEVFAAHCAECHGSYGASEQEDYPERLVPWETVGTDRVRLDALTREDRARYARSWFAGYDEDQVVLQPEGYVAPPLDGIWASAPYLHNGSVPTLWHLLHPDQRPVVWRRGGRPGYDYDTGRVGLLVDVFEAVPDDVRSSAGLSELFDTRRPGKSHGGHDFPSRLTEREKRAVLEYLKTL